MLLWLSDLCKKLSRFFAVIDGRDPDGIYIKTNKEDTYEIYKQLIRPEEGDVVQSSQESSENNN